METSKKKKQKKKLVPKRKAYCCCFFFIIIITPSQTGSHIKKMLATRLTTFISTRTIRGSTLRCIGSQASYSTSPGNFTNSFTFSPHT